MLTTAARAECFRQGIAPARLVQFPVSARGRPDVDLEVPSTCVMLVAGSLLIAVTLRRRRLRGDNGRGGLGGMARRCG
jgi:hypothetical protein